MEAVEGLPRGPWEAMGRESPSRLRGGEKGEERRGEGMGWSITKVGIYHSGQ